MFKLRFYLDTRPPAGRPACPPPQAHLWAGPALVHTDGKVSCHKEGQLQHFGGTVPRREDWILINKTRFF